MSLITVTYPEIKDQYKVYTWIPPHPEIDQVGHFAYFDNDFKLVATKTPNRETEIGEAQPIMESYNAQSRGKSTLYDIPNRISSMSYTTIEIKTKIEDKTFSAQFPKIPKGTPFGWDHYNNCWIYLTEKGPFTAWYNHKIDPTPVESFSGISAAEAAVAAASAAAAPAAEVAATPPAAEVAAPPPAPPGPTEFSGGRKLNKKTKTLKNLRRK